MLSKKNIAFPLSMRAFSMSFLFFFCVIFVFSVDQITSAQMYAYAAPIAASDTASGNVAQPPKQVQQAGIENVQIQDQESSLERPQNVSVDSVENIISSTAPINTINEILPSLCVQAKQDRTFLAPYMSYAYNINARDPQDVYNARAMFKPYRPLELDLKLGTYWFLIHFDAIKDKSVAASYLDVGNFLPKNSKILILPKNAKQWQVIDDVYTREKLGVVDYAQQEKEKQEAKNINPIDALKNDLEEHTSLSIFSSGLYDLTSLRDGGELLIYSPGMPSLWFSPSLVLPAKAALSFDRRIAPFVLISLVLLMFFSLWRGLREEGDARLWATLLTFFALIQYVWGVPENSGVHLSIWNMIGVMSASCALFLLPHIGRHYMITEKHAPSLDAFLQFLALPAVFPIAIMLVPLGEYLFVIGFAPLWGLYAFVPLVFCLPAMLKRQKGALFYVFFCFCIGGGALLGFYFRYNPEWHIAPQVGLVLAMSTMFLAPRQTEKNVIEQESEQVDLVGDLVENSIPMREAFFRVEAKLREPFDKIIREVCFLDFDTKAEDFIYSIDLLKEKEAYDKYEKNDINAIDDLVRRSERLQKHASALVRACRDMSSMMGDMPQLARKVSPFQAVHELFNLKNLVLQTFDLIRDEAQNKQIGLGWYIAPQMGLFYRGDKSILYSVIELLLKDAVRATEKGMISLRVRRANSPNPGHIVFTISDSGKGRPPIERSPLTLIKAWELATNYNGDVQLHSSPTGLSFSFSMECIAMDAQGLKALSFASLDDIVLLNHEKNILKENEKIDIDAKKSTFDSQKLVAQTKTLAGESGGNIVFSKEIPQEFLDKKQYEHIEHIDSQEFFEEGIAPSSDSHALIRAKKETVPSFAQTEAKQVSAKEASVYNKSHATNILHDVESVHHQSESAIEQEFDSEINSYSQYTPKNRVSILLISPLAIQRQNFAWYLNQYELWEALDVDSALAFYAKKPAILVIVHSALSASDCNAVLAGIRLLEDSLGISPAPFLGLYQSAKDMESLKVAGCKHLLPATIGREDLCTAVAEIMENPFLNAISDIHAPYFVLKSEQKEKKEQADTQEKAKLAVEKRLNMKRVNAGQVIDGALDLMDELPFSQKLEEVPQTMAKTYLGQAENADTYNNQPKNQISAEDLEKSKIQSKVSYLPYFQSDERFAQEKSKQALAESENIARSNVSGENSTQMEPFKLPESGHAFAEQTGIMAKLLHIIRPKPHKSIQTDDYIIDDLVGEAMPIVDSSNKLEMIKGKSEEAFNNDAIEDFVADDTFNGDMQFQEDIQEKLEAINSQTSSQNFHDKLAEQAEAEQAEAEQAEAEQAEAEQAEAEQAEEFKKTFLVEPENENTDSFEEYVDNSKEELSKNIAEKEKVDSLALSFLPTEEQQYQALDEDVPMLGTLSLNAKSENLSGTYADLESQSTFIHAGLLALHGENQSIILSEEKSKSMNDLPSSVLFDEESSSHESFLSTSNHLDSLSFSQVDLQTKDLTTTEKEHIEENKRNLIEKDFQEESIFTIDIEDQENREQGTSLDFKTSNREEVSKGAIEKSFLETTNFESEKELERDTSFNNENMRDAEDEVIELTSSMLVAGITINPDKISSERRAQNAQDALLNLDLEMPEQNMKRIKGSKNKKIKNKNKSSVIEEMEEEKIAVDSRKRVESKGLDIDLTDFGTSRIIKQNESGIKDEGSMDLEMDSENLQREVVEDSNENTTKKSAQKPKIEQLSFFPVDPK